MVARLQADVANQRWAALGDNVKNTLRAGLAAVVLTASMACGKSTATSPSDLTSTTSSRATFNITVRPSPIKATRCNPQCPGESGSQSFAFSADMMIDVQDSATVGATVNSITLTATADGSPFAPLAFSSDELRRMVGTTRVDGQATLSIPLTIVYNTPSGSANLNVNVSVQITDERGNQVTATGQVNVV
jgi:hypothetical protein